IFYDKAYHYDKEYPDKLKQFLKNGLPLEELEKVISKHLTTIALDTNKNYMRRHQTRLWLLNHRPSIKHCRFTGSTLSVKTFL
ncbi:hypothetical protein ACK899_26650, partial [Klebsiella pneumoniae]|uniref:hypothetical protein n=1 Tax=Klebsiella pneumoniae TaxID=573 RepID=UPI003976FA03